MKVKDLFSDGTNVFGGIRIEEWEDGGESPTVLFDGKKPTQQQLEDIAERVVDCIYTYRSSIDYDVILIELKK